MKGITDLPFELQVKILQNLSEKDLEQLYQVSYACRVMVRCYQTGHSTIKLSEWRWYCRHAPCRENCKNCYVQANKKHKERSPSEWDWWLYDDEASGSY